MPVAIDTSILISAERLNWAVGGCREGAAGLARTLKHGRKLLPTKTQETQARLAKTLEEGLLLKDNPSMSATILDKKHRLTLPESICTAVDLKPNDQVEWRVEDGEIRGRKLVPQKPKEAFPRGSLLKYLTPERDKEQLAILSGCVQEPAQSK